MNQYILISNIKVQNANAISGFTWGFPAITHFLGFTHNLSRKLSRSNEYKQISLTGCAVISHKHHVHTYDNYGKQFSQLKTAAYLKKDIEIKARKTKSPSIIEEGRMNMTVSLLIEYTGYVGGNSRDDFIKWLERNCYLQRLAGGTILSIDEIKFFDLSNNEATTNLRILKRKLLPGFLLVDQSAYLEEHYDSLVKKDKNTELLDAWFDFIELKQKARPKYNLISQHITKLYHEDEQSEVFINLSDEWEKQLDVPYQQDNVSSLLKTYFSNLEANKKNENLIEQWKQYCQPTDKTDADWEFIQKPKKGYLVPIMTGYKAISKIYPNKEVKNTRDNETDVCFVESIHSIGEWKSVHRIRQIDELSNSIWRYFYQDNWYLCKQEQPTNEQQTERSDY